MERWKRSEQVHLQEGDRLLAEAIRSANANQSYPLVQDLASDHGGFPAVRASLRRILDYSHKEENPGFRVRKRPQGEQGAGGFEYLEGGIQTKQRRRVGFEEWPMGFVPEVEIESIEDCDYITLGWFRVSRRLHGDPTVPVSDILPEDVASSIVNCARGIDLDFKDKPRPLEMPLRYFKEALTIVSEYLYNSPDITNLTQLIDQQTPIRAKSGF